MYNPFRDIIKSDELSPDHANKLFVPEASPIWSDIQLPLNQIIVGPRGAGKTIALRQLDHVIDRDSAIQSGFIGLYIQISRVSTIFKGLFEPAEQNPHHISKNILQRLFSDYLWLEITRTLGGFLELHVTRNSVSINRSSISRISGFQAETIQDLDLRCSQLQIDIEREISKWAVTRDLSWNPLADLSASLQRCATELRKMIPTLRKDRPSLYLLLDESSPIPIQCQEVINGLLHRGRSYCVKLAVRAFEWESLQTSVGATIELDTDVVLLRIRYPDELQSDYIRQMKSVVRRILQTHPPENLRTLVDYQGPDVGGLFPSDPRGKLYSGFDQICAASSGNPQNLLQICSSIFAKSGADPSQATPIFSPTLQDDAIRSWSRDYEDRNPYSESRTFCRGLLRAIRTQKGGSKTIGFSYTHKDINLFTTEYLPQNLAVLIKSAFSGGFLRSSTDQDASLSQVPRVFHLSRGLLPREGLALSSPIAPVTEIDSDFIRKNSHEQRGSPQLTSSNEDKPIKAFLSTSFSPLLNQQRNDIKNYLQNVGIHCVDVEDSIADQFLFSAIYRHIRNCDLTILDATETRPYTMFEIGLCAGSTKPKCVIGVVNDFGTSGSLFQLDGFLKKLPILTFSFDESRLRCLASQIFSRAQELLQKPNEFAKISLTGVSLRPRRRPKTAYISFPTGPYRSRAIKGIKRELEKHGWSVVIEEDAGQYSANEFQVPVYCAHLSRVGIIDTSGLDQPDLLQCYKLGLFAGKQRWRVLQTEEARVATPSTFSSVPDLDHVSWKSLDHLVESAVNFVLST